MDFICEDVSLWHFGKCAYLLSHWDRWEDRYQSHICTVRRSYRKDYWLISMWDTFVVRCSARLWPNLKCKQLLLAESTPYHFSFNTILTLLFVHLLTFLSLSCLKLYFAQRLIWSMCFGKAGRIFMIACKISCSDATQAGTCEHCLSWGNGELCVWRFISVAILIIQSIFKTHMQLLQSYCKILWSFMKCLFLTKPIYRVLWGKVMEGLLFCTLTLQYSDCV